MAIADIGVFGGSGLYRFLDDVEEVAVETPYGDPSSPLQVGAIGDRRVAFLPRHGADHRHPPHRINYRANLDAMRQAGVGAIFAPCASGSLHPDVAPGHFVVVDQFVDRTWGRPDTFWDEGAADHVSMATHAARRLHEMAGNLAAILDIATKKHPGAKDAGVQITMVAGAGFEPATFRL